jgi:hypothetical protein
MFIFGCGSTTHSIGLRLGTVSFLKVIGRKEDELTAVPIAAWQERLSV